MMADPRVPAARTRTVTPLLRPLPILLALLTLSLAPPARSAPADTTRLWLGAEERVRSENWNDLTDFNAQALDARHQLRLRTRAWARVGFGANEVAVGLLNESRRLSTPRVPLQMDETVFETLYLEHRFSEGASVRIGRQNISKGDGFLLMDGSPLDGSRSSYLNALDLAWTRGASRLDVLLVSDPWRDEYLPVLHDRTKGLVEYDERAGGAYWSGPAPRGGATLDGYWLYKSETSSSGRLADRMFHTVGGRVARDFAGGWSLRAELAGQAGSQEPSMDVRAWGGQASVTRALAVRMKASLTLGVVALSGDDPATPRRNEGWDPLFSRWPKWSAGYIYALATERGAAYWTDLSILQAEARFSPLRQVDARVSYQRLGAFHAWPGRAAIYGDGLVRGDLLGARMDVTLNDSWRGHVVAEHLSPGDFYSHSDPGWFFRVEGICSLQHLFAYAGRVPQERPIASGK